MLTCPLFTQRTLLSRVLQFADKPDYHVLIRATREGARWPRQAVWSLSSFCLPHGWVDVACLYRRFLGGWAMVMKLTPNGFAGARISRPISAQKTGVPEPEARPAATRAALWCGNLRHKAAKNAQPRRAVPARFPLPAARPGPGVAAGAGIVRRAAMRL